MKKLGITLLGILLFCVGFVIYDYKLAQDDYKSYIKFVELVEKPPFEYTFKIIPFSFKWKALYYSGYLNSERKKIVCDGVKCKRPIIILGCSCAEGTMLDTEQIFSYKLSKRTQRTVYNRAEGGWTISNMLYQLRQPEFYNDIDPKNTPEYAIYVFLPHHLRLIYNYQHCLDRKEYLSFEPKNGELIEKNPIDLQLSRFYVYRKHLIRQFQLKLNGSKKDKDKNFDLIKLYFENSRRELQKKYPNIKFVILKYPYELQGLADRYTYHTSRWKELEDEGFIIRELGDYFEKGDILTDKYMFSDGHPKTTTWDVVCDKLAKDLKL